MSDKYVQVDVDGWLQQTMDATEYYIGEDVPGSDEDVDVEKAVWVPNSLVRNYTAFMDGDENFLVIPEWKATELGLEMSEVEGE